MLAQLAGPCCPLECQGGRSPSIKLVCAVHVPLKQQDGHNAARPRIAANVYDHEYRTKGQLILFE